MTRMKMRKVRKRRPKPFMIGTSEEEPLKSMIRFGYCSKEVALTMG